MNILAVFDFNQSKIRFIDDKPVAKDVAKALGYADPQATISKKVFTQNKGVAKMETPGGVQSVTVLEEAGIYQLIFSSKLESAQKFQQWVFEDILPSIRKTGQYQIVQEPELPKTYLDALKCLVASEEQKALLTAKIEKDAPLVEYAEAVQCSDTDIDFNTFAKMIGTGRTRLFRALRDLGVIMQNSTLPYQKWMDAGYFEACQEITGDGKLRPFAVITGKGQIWLKQKLDTLFANPKTSVSTLFDMDSYLHNVENPISRDRD